MMLWSIGPWRSYALIRAIYALRAASAVIVPERMWAASSIPVAAGGAGTGRGARNPEQAVMNTQSGGSARSTREL